MPLANRYLNSKGNTDKNIMDKKDKETTILKRIMTTIEVIEDREIIGDKEIIEEKVIIVEEDTIKAIIIIMGRKGTITEEEIKETKIIKKNKKKMIVIIDECIERYSFSDY